MMASVLEIKSLSKTYGEQLALGPINLNLESGRTSILLGSSGSGKSTLLRAILGLIKTDEGSILFNGAAVAEWSPPTRAMRIGYVPQGGSLFPHMTAAANASIVARALGWDKARIQKRFKEILPIFSVEENLLTRKPHQLSGGQRQRVALMRAAFTDPELLLLDEPLGALDPLVRASLQEELKEIFSRLRKTVVFVTHDIGEAAYLGDYIVLMHEGRVVQDGTFADLRERPASEFVTRFLNAQRLSAREAK